MQKLNKFLLLGTVFILGGISLFIYNLLEDSQVGNNTDLILDRLQEEEAIGHSEDMSPDYMKNPYMEMPVVLIDDKEYIGYISIPSLELELPVLSSWSYPNIKISPARYQGSVYLNNMIILAHNYKSHFGKLHRLEIGDIIIFNDMDNNTFNFTVQHKEELDSVQVEEMISSDWDLTLFTCTLGGKARTTIRCNLTNKNLVAY